MWFFFYVICFGLQRSEPFSRVSYHILTLSLKRSLNYSLDLFAQKLNKKKQTRGYFEMNCSALHPLNYVVQSELMTHRVDGKTKGLHLSMSVLNTILCCCCSCYSYESKMYLGVDLGGGSRGGGCYCCLHNIPATRLCISWTQKTIVCASTLR